MGIRNIIATKLLNAGRGLGQRLGTELVVDASDHSLELSMEVPGTDDRAWDSTMYKRGQLYIKGYANPVKPDVEYNEELAEPDRTDLNEPKNVEDKSDGDTTAHTQLISSPRYREYMRQDLISQLLNPREQWRIIAYAIIGMSLILVANLVVSLSAAGVF